MFGTINIHIDTIRARAFWYSHLGTYAYDEHDNTAKYHYYFASRVTSKANAFI